MGEVKQRGDNARRAMVRQIMAEHPTVTADDVKTLALALKKQATGKNTAAATEQAGAYNVLTQVHAAMVAAGVADTAGLQAALAARIDDELKERRLPNATIADAANDVWLELAKLGGAVRKQELFEATAEKLRQRANRVVVPVDVERALRAAGATLQDAPLWAYGFTKLVERIGYHASKEERTQVDLLLGQVQALRQEVAELRKRNVSDGVDFS